MKLDLNSLKYLPKNSVLVKREWVKNTSSNIEIVTDIGGKYNAENYILQIEKVRYDEKIFNDLEIKNGDIILLDKRVHARLMDYKNTLEANGTQYCNINVGYICGVFKDKNISLDSLEMFGRNILIEPIKTETLPSGIEVSLDEDDAIIGKVVKKSYSKRKDLKDDIIHDINEGDTLAFINNSHTKIFLEGKTYYIMSSQDTVGRFTDSAFGIDEIKLFAGRTLMSYDRIKYSGLIEMHEVEDSEFDWSGLRGKVYRVEKTNKDMPELTKGVKILSNKNAVDYVTLRKIKYYLLRDNSLVEAIIKD